MEKRMKRRRGPQLDDHIPFPRKDLPKELIQLIQSRMPVKEAARTCVLSKTWLCAWSTIPTLRFRQAFRLAERREHLKVVDRTLLRYLRDNISIESLDLEMDIENQELESLADSWITPVATKNCLKQLSLSIFGSYTLPHEILYGRNLNKLRVSGCQSKIHSVWISSNPVMIKCVSLRVLHLTDVHISEELLNNLLSTCSLLEKIHLERCKGFQIIKVKNHRFLTQLVIRSEEQNDTLEIDDVPNLRLFDYHTTRFQRNPLPFNMNSLHSVTRLFLSGVIIDGAFLDTINSKFPFLKSLTLDMKFWRSGSFSITCVTLEILSLCSCNNMLTDVLVYAPKLCFFDYSGMTIPTLLFPAIAPKLIKVKLTCVSKIIDGSFFLKMREALTLSSKFKIEIGIMDFRFLEAFNIDIDDLKRRVSFPATNVQHLSFRMPYNNSSLWERSPFLDGFFTICHPKHVVAYPGVDLQKKRNNYFGKLMVKEVLEKETRKGYWPDYLKDVKIYNHLDRKWEIVTGFLDSSAIVKWYFVKFKLNWC